MKQKTRYNNLGNISISYRSMNGRYISIDIGPERSHIGQSLVYGFWHFKCFVSE